MKYYYKEGQVYNEHHKLMGSKDKKGYVKFATCEGSRKTIKHWLAHRWIWTHFNGPIPKGYEVDHINFNPSDNRIENLQLLTRYEHRQRRSKKGTIIQRASGLFQALINNKHIGMYATLCGAQMGINTRKLNVN
jgi:hypothetical protein